MTSPFPCSSETIGKLEVFDQIVNPFSPFHEDGLFAMRAPTSRSGGNRLNFKRYWRFMKSCAIPGVVPV
jgi:hypothetical protein